MSELAWIERKPGIWALVDLKGGFLGYVEQKALHEILSMKPMFIAYRIPAEDKAGKWLGSFRTLERAKEKVAEELAYEEGCRYAAG